jgi:hypothetical protein
MFDVITTLIKQQNKQETYQEPFLDGVSDLVVVYSSSRVMELRCHGSVSM